MRLPPLKDRQAAADPLGMHPGGRSGLARRLLAISIALTAGLALAPVEGVADARTTVTRGARTGEAGTGVPAFRFVIPRSGERLTASVAWSDVPNSYWARTAINYVGKANAWMRDYPADKDGTYPFKPGRDEPRKMFARAMVRAFSPRTKVDTSIHFKDLPDDASFYRFANIAVQRGWMHAAGGKFLPDQGVSMALVHHAIVFALGLRKDAAGLDQIHTRSGFTFHTPPNFGTTLIGMRLGLRFNHSDESLDVHPDDLLPRSEVAWSLYRAKTLSSYAISSMEPYATIELPNVGPAKQRFIQWGIRYVGYPYVWGGEWDKATGSGYCCGSQPIGGFDCSGLTWWIMKHSAGGWDNTPPRPYGGWALPQRTSHDMATVGNIGWRRIAPGDLMFYDGDKDGTVDHVDTYVGNGWSLDSSGTPAGVTIMWVGTGWYHDHFVHARNIIG